MNDTLRRLQNLTRRDLLREIRRATGMEDILLWEMIAYGDMWRAVRAGPKAAGHLGVRTGDIIGYAVEGSRPKGSAVGDLMHAVPQSYPPHPDPFRPD